MSTDRNMITLTDSPGLHLVAYYCCNEHLLLKFADFIKQGIELGEKCYYCLEPDKVILLHKVLQQLGLDVEAAVFTGNLEALPFEDIYYKYRSEGFDFLKTYVFEMLQQAIEEGFTGMRWVGDSQYGIMRLDQKNYQNWENDLENLLREVPFINLCLYNVEDLFTDNRQITDQIIVGTMQNHKYFYYGNLLIRTESIRAKMGT